ncbi:hypothetical protein A2198_02545 [Candidatus Peribacteria bacterium RIFOXYA1_FULL_56_14]|nr:MAG: hypothetical protein A2198_02545 [Candidatus Peribacteria bacterium RIFOXYA1_FULL_56_14]HBU29604.1 hypothetical protein [Thiobacillus sp.]
MWSYIYPGPEILQRIIEDGIYREMPRNIPVSITLAYKPHTDLEIEVSITAPDAKIGVMDFESNNPPGEDTFVTHYPALHWTMTCRLDMDAHFKRWPDVPAGGPLTRAMMQLAGEFLRTYFDTERVVE